MLLTNAIEKMIDFYKGNIHDIDHFIKVWTLAKTIGEAEKLDETTQEILEMAAVVPFNQVSAEHAYKEGEDDRSLEKWREVHRRAFTPDYRAAGLDFDENGDCVLEEFQVVYR